MAIRVKRRSGVIMHVVEHVEPSHLMSVTNFFPRLRFFFSSSPCLNDQVNPPLRTVRASNSQSYSESSHHTLYYRD